MRREFSTLGLLTGGLLAATVVTAGVAAWQFREVGARDSMIAELRKFLTEADQAASMARRQKHALEIELQDALAERGAARKRSSQDALGAELAAVRQQLSAAETAMVETEDRLADEVSAHADLKRKADQLAEQLAAAERKIEMAEAKVERAQTELAKLQALAAARDSAPVSTPPSPESAPLAAKRTDNDAIGATGSLPDEASEDRSATPAQVGPAAVPPQRTRKAVVKKPRPPRQIAKPAVKATKPEGGIFDPLLEPQP